MKNKYTKKIFLLCNGLGKRFSEEGYLYPKPLIHVNGQHIIFNTLDEIYSGKTNYDTYILYNSCWDNYEFVNLIKNRYRNKNIQFLKLEDTNGPAEKYTRD